MDGGRKTMGPGCREGRAPVPGNPTDPVHGRRGLCLDILTLLWLCSTRD